MNKPSGELKSNGTECLANYVSDLHAAVIIHLSRVDLTAVIPKDIRSKLLPHNV